jgi:anthranilate/para-aminobenzoate synthase component I
MKDFHGVIQKLKRYLAKGKNVKVLDKEVANALEISQAKFATIKKRNSTPYESILKFCKKEELCCSEIFFD